MTPDGEHFVPSAAKETRVKVASFSDCPIFHTNLGRQSKSQPEAEEEIDIDFMRAIELSLLQYSTPANQRSRQSSSSSSSASLNRDQAQGAQTPQDLAVFSAVDGASLQKAIELSLQDSTAGGSDVFCRSNILLL